MWNADALKELGKYFMNLSLAIFVSLILQPFATDKLNYKLIAYGIITSLTSLILGFYIVNLSDKFNNHE